ncbi:MAG: tail fiber domain-containing protein, partial [archaeon]
DRVGIGTASPNVPLDVFTNTNAYGIYTGNATAQLRLSGTAGTNKEYALIQTESSARPLILMRDGGNVGIGTTSPRSQLDVFTSAGSNPQITLSDNDVSHTFTEVDNEVLVSIGSWSALVGGGIITGYSDAGTGTGMGLRGYIGAVDPTDTVPAVVFRAGKVNTQGAPSDLGSLETAYQFQDSDGNTNFMTILGGGEVGIGTTSPELTSGSSDALLEISGSTNPALSLEDKEGIQWTFYNDGTNFIMMSDTTNTFQFSANDITPYTDNAKNLGSVAKSWGCLVYNGGSLGSCASDVRLKENITSGNFENILDKINKLEIKKFKFINATGMQRGLIAQDVQKIFPELVVRGEDGYLKLNYGDIQWITLQAIQEQQSMIEDLQIQNQNLQKQIENMQTEMCSKGEWSWC